MNSGRFAAGAGAGFGVRCAKNGCRESVDKGLNPNIGGTAVCELIESLRFSSEKP